MPYAAVASVEGFVADEHRDVRLASARPVMGGKDGIAALLFCYNFI